MAYCFQVTLKNLAKPHTPGLTPLEILEKFATIRMVDFHQPTADGRHLILPRYTQLDGAHKLLLHQLGLKLPKQPPPRLRI